MKAVEHKVKHYYQPTNSSCGYASLAMLLSYYDFHITPKEVIKQVNVRNHGKESGDGSVTAQLAAWVVTQGYDVEFYSFDSQITDLSWSKLSQQEILEQLKKVKDVRDVKALGGKEWSKLYVQAYIDLIKSGGILHVRPYVTTKLLYALLNKGPVYANIASTTLRGKGRQRMVGLHKSITDDINGTTATHSIVIYGNDEKGNFLIADPWVGLVVIEPETIAVVITAAQIECDNQVFVIER